MITTVAATAVLVVMAACEERAKALASMEYLGGRCSIDPSKPGKPMVPVAMTKVGSQGEGIKCLVPVLRSGSPSAGRHAPR